MKKRYVTRKNESYKVNPWSGDLAATIATKNKITGIGKANALINLETGEISSSASIAMTKLQTVDKQEFVKIFEGGISSIFELSKAARDLFQSMLQIYIDQKFQADRVYLSTAALEDVGYTRSRVTKNNALNQLLDLDFIAQVKNDKAWFWVNPSMFFKGDRMVMVREFAVNGTADGDALGKKIKSLESEVKQMKLV